MEVEDDIRVPVPPRHSVHPQFLHEEHLIGVLLGGAVSVGPGFRDPIGQVPDEVKEEFVLRDAEYLVGYLDEETEPLAGDQVEVVDDSLAEVPRPGRGLHQ